MIKALRFEQGLTQADMAEKVNLSVASVSEYERGNRPRFTRGTALAFEEALGITDRRLLIALGYETGGGDDGRHTLSYGGQELGRITARRQILEQQLRTPTGPVVLNPDEAVELLTMPDSRDQLRAWVLRTIRRIDWDGRHLDIHLAL